MYEIGNTAYALLSKRIKICNSCEESMREFSLYHYRLDKEGRKIPVEKNNRAMDEIRYFVHTILNGRWLERTTNQVGEGSVVRNGLTTSVLNVICQHSVQRIFALTVVRKWNQMVMWTISMMNIIL